jgi:DNA-directed RNA polymerase specialized sigma24 family protein
VPEPVTTSVDDDLLPAISAGDAAAFARWLAGAEDRLRGSLRSFAERVDVEAVLQEALVRIWQVAPRVVPDGRPHALLRLAIRIARNLAVSERLAADTEAFEPAPDRWRDPLLRRAIEECRERLPAKPAQALQTRLASAGAEPDARLAERVGMRPNTFLQNIARARRFLADCLRKRGIDLALELS